MYICRLLECYDKCCMYCVWTDGDDQRKEEGGALNGGQAKKKRMCSDTTGQELCPLNWWALGAGVLVLATAAGNILVCLAIAWERRLQNVTNYFLMSLAITDLMVAILVMPLGILTLVRGNQYNLLLLFLLKTNYSFWPK